MKRILLFLSAIALVSQACAQVPSYVPTDGLVGWWPFNGSANDESGNGNNGTVNGATLTADRNGVENTAYSFDGNDFIQIENSPSLNVESVTISSWVQPQSFTDGGQGNQRLIVSKRESAGWGNSYQFGLDGNSNYNGFHADWTINGNGGVYYTDNSLIINQWYHLVYTHSETDAKLFLNGNLVAQVEINGILSSNSLPMRIGSRPSGAHPFLGIIDDIGIWNRALTEEEIQQLYTGCTVEPTAIVGDIAPLNFTTAEYFCNDNPGSTFEWTVTNGVISSGQGTNNIVVLWNNEGIGTLSVVETNAEGCVGQPVLFEVEIQCSSNISEISGNNFPVILQSENYTVNGPIESEYLWSVTNGVIASGQGTNSVNVIWAAEGEGTLSVIETTNTGCESPAVTITTNAVITSVFEEELTLLLLYPNPASERITLQCEAALMGEEYVVYDVLGREVMRGKISNTTTNIDVKAWSAGEYVIRVGNKSVKAVKQ